MLDVAFKSLYSMLLPRYYRSRHLYGVSCFNEKPKSHSPL